MDQELAKAAKVIEEAGGFVMFPENSQEERDIRKQTHNLELQKEAEAQAEIDEGKADFESRKKDAFKEATHALYHRKTLSYQDIDDIFFENGIEPDYIEDWIESQI
jgi:hypothetical protein